MVEETKPNSEVVTIVDNETTKKSTEQPQDDKKVEVVANLPSQDEKEKDNKSSEEVEKLIADTYKEKYEKIIAEKDKAIKERDERIRSLIMQDVKEEENVEEHKIADKINAKRTFKKW